MLNRPLLKLGVGGGGGCGGPTHGEAVPRRGTIFRLQVQERAGISLILVCKKDQMG